MQPTVPSDNSTPESLSTEANDTTVFDALLKEESEPLSTDEHARVLGSFGNLLRASRVSPETASWCASRGLESTTAKEFGAVYLPEKVVTLDDAQAVADQLGVEIAALIRTGILLRRKLKPFIAPRLTGTKDDLDTDTTDRRRKLDRFRFVHGGRVAYPLRDLEGHVRGLKSRAVHGDLRAAAGDYDLEETDPPDAKYLHSKRPVREKRAFQLLFSPALIEVIGGSITAAEARTPQNLKDRRSLWITEGDVDCMLAAQAGALSVGLGGCESHEGQVVEIMRALEEAAKQYLSIYLCLDTDPGRWERGREMKLGPGQRGACDLIRKLRAKSEKVARLIHVVLLPSGEEGVKQDLADMLKAAGAPEAQAAKLRELEAGGLDQVAFAVRLLDGTKPEDRTSNLKATGLWDLAAKDPDLFFARAEEIGGALGLKPKEIDPWAKRTVKAAKKEADSAPPEITEDPLAEFTDNRGRREAVYECIRSIVEMIDGSQADKDKLYWDEMSLVPVYEGREFTDHALGELRRRMAREFKCHPKHASEIRVVVENVAQGMRRHPVREYLGRLLPWDGVDRISMVLEEVLGIAPESESQRRLYTTFLRKWMVGAVARVHATPECTVKFDNVLVLGGKQDLRKSGFFDHLVPVERWSGSPDISGFDDNSAIKLAPLWIAEMAESNGSSYWKDLERQKAWLSKRADILIRKYCAYSEIIPRRFALGATVNEKQHGADSSGFRREWCMWLERQVNTLLLKEIRDQVWAQAYAAYLAWDGRGRKEEECPWWLDEEEKALHLIDGQRFQIADFELDRVRAWLNSQTDRRVVGVDVAVGIGIEKAGSGDGRRISRHMQALGWLPAPPSNRGTQFDAPEGWRPGGLTLHNGGPTAEAVAELVANLTDEG